MRPEAIYLSHLKKPWEAIRTLLGLLLIIPYFGYCLSRYWLTSNRLKRVSQRGREEGEPLAGEVIPERRR